MSQIKDEMIYGLIDKVVELQKYESPLYRIDLTFDVTPQKEQSICYGYANTLETAKKFVELKFQELKNEFGKVTEVKKRELDEECYLSFRDKKKYKFEFSIRPERVITWELLQNEFTTNGERD